MDGWIKIYRKILDWEWYNDNNTKILFLHLLLTANHKEKQWQGHKIKRGQKLTSIQHLAKEVNLSIQQTRTSLSKLKSTHEITIKTTNKNTLITIEKYDNFQSKDEEDNKQTNKQTNKQITTNKNEKNIKNIKENIKRKDPTLEEIENYILEKKLKVNAKQFYDYFSEGNWIDSKGNKVKNWKQKLLTWNKFQTSVEDKKTNYNNYEQRTYEDMDKFYANKF